MEVASHDSGEHSSHRDWPRPPCATRPAHVIDGIRPKIGRAIQRARRPARVDRRGRAGTDHAPGLPAPRS
jgi:hypothetical protein